MALASLEQFRKITNFTTSDILNTEVESLIADSDRAIVRLTTSEVYLERLEGNVDGVNTGFRTKFTPIADSTGSGDVGVTDAKVFYAITNDNTNFRELGTAQVISSIQSKEGIITMQTPPTEITAEAGVFVTYRYEAQGDSSLDIRKLASCQFLGHLVAKKLRGRIVEQFSIDKSVRQEKTDTDWLGLVYETLALQDKLYLNKIQGSGIPGMMVR